MEKKSWAFLSKYPEAYKMTHLLSLAKKCHTSTDRNATSHLSPCWEIDNLKLKSSAVPDTNMHLTYLVTCYKLSPYVITVCKSRVPILPCLLISGKPVTRQEYHLTVRFREKFYIQHNNQQLTITTSAASDKRNPHAVFSFSCRIRLSQLQKVLSFKPFT